MMLLHPLDGGKLLHAEVSMEELRAIQRGDRNATPSD